MIKDRLLTCPFDMDSISTTVELIETILLNSGTEISDIDTIKFIGPPLVFPEKLCVIIELYLEAKEDMKFIIATGEPLVNTGCLENLKEFITLDYDNDKHTLPAYKVKILEEFNLKVDPDNPRFWNHSNGHIISIVKVLKSTEEYLTDYLKSLTRVS